MGRHDAVQVKATASLFASDTQFFRSPVLGQSLATAV